MSYQYWPIKKIPFICSYANPLEFPGNYHSEMELLYCVQGKLTNVIEGKTYTITEGQVLIVSSGALHERYNPDVPTKVVFTKFASLLLGEAYKELSSQFFPEPVINLNSPEVPEDIRAAFADLHNFSEVYRGRAGISYHDWLVKSAIFRIATYILEKVPHVESSCLNRGHQKMNVKIQSAMSLIEDSYKYPITIDDVSKKLGYEKTYFCKIFKESTGESFHKFLNRYRVRIAKAQLASSDAPIGEIASACGFTQFKTFCKVFKAETGYTPSDYRAQAHN